MTDNHTDPDAPSTVGASARTLRSRLLRRRAGGVRNRQLLARRAVAMAVAAAIGAAVIPAVSEASTASVTLTAGSLAFVSAPPNVTFPGATLTGLNLSVTAPQAIDISDATGSASGWDVTATSTTFTSGGNTLPTTATTIASAPTDACDTNSTCTLATNAIGYPYSLPAATTAPTATKLFNAAATTGAGNQTITPTWSLAIPAGSHAGAYSSTWTLTLASGP